MNIVIRKLNNQCNYSAADNIGKGEPMWVGYNGRAGYRRSEELLQDECTLLKHMSKSRE